MRLYQGRIRFVERYSVAVVLEMLCNYSCDRVSPSSKRKLSTTCPVSRNSFRTAGGRLTCVRAVGDSSRYSIRKNHNQVCPRFYETFDIDALCAHYIIHGRSLHIQSSCKFGIRQTELLDTSINQTSNVYFR